MVAHADLLYFVDRLREVKGHHVRTNAEVLSIGDVYSLLRDVHPSAALASEVHHVEVFEAVELQLGVASRQSSALDLQGQ